MPTRATIAGGVILLALGSAALGAGAWAIASSPVAEARLALTVAARPTPENFAEVAAGSSQIVATLAEIGTFEDFREEVLSSGFAVPPELFPGASDQARKAWEERVRVSRIGDSQVLRVRAYGGDPAASRAIARAVTHALALRAPSIVGDGVVRVHVERVPLLRYRVPEPLMGGLVGAGAGVVVLGIAGVLRGARRRADAQWDRSSAAPARGRPGRMRDALPRTSPEDARYWLQQFLADHQNVPRRSHEEIRTWDDVPAPSPVPDVMKPPDPLEDSPRSVAQAD